MSPNPVSIKLTPEQRALIEQASGKKVTELGIEGTESDTGWLYVDRKSKKSWLLKNADPDSYSAARSSQQPRIEPRYTRFQLKIGESRIHRWGVFAAERIPARRNVIEYLGEIINPVEAYRRAKDATENYLFALDDFWRIDGAIGGSGAEFINHCCDPNLRWRRQGGRVMCQSARPIAAGEELTLDYGFSAKAPKVPCRCGSPKCRGTINRLKGPKSRRRSGATKARKSRAR